MTISIKATRAQSGSGDPSSISGPTVIVKGANNTYTITDYDSFAIYQVSTTAGTVSRTNETITLSVVAGETATSLRLTINRDGSEVSRQIAIGAQSITTPTITSPASGSTNVSLPVTLLSTAFSSNPTGAATHVSSDWRVKNSGGTIIWSSIGDTANKTSITIPASSLTPNTQYFAEVRYTGSAIGSSAYSTPSQFTTSPVSIVRPSITAPVDGATGIGATPTFTSSTFATLPTGSDTHASSSWRVKNSGGTVIWSSLNNTVDRTSITLPSGLLVVASTYTVEVQYNGATLPTSPWSIPVTFATAASFEYGKYLIARTIAFGQDVDTFNSLGALPNAALFNGIAFSPDGTYVSMATDSPPYVRVYNRSGDVFTEATAPTGATGSTGLGISISADSQYIAAAINNGGLQLYKKNGSSWNSLSVPVTKPTAGNAVAFSADGAFLAVAGTPSPFLYIYSRSGDTFTKLANPVGIPSTAGTAVAFSPDGTYLAVGSTSQLSSGSPWLRVFKRSDTTFTNLSLTGLDLPPGSVTSVSFSPDGVYLAAACNSGSSTRVYKRSGDVFTKVSDITDFPAQSVAFSGDGLYLALGSLGSASPSVVIYKRSGDTFTKLANPTGAPTSASVAVAFYPPVLGR